MGNSFLKERKISCRWAGVQRLSKCLICSISFISLEVTLGVRQPAGERIKFRHGSQACAHRSQYFSGVLSARVWKLPAERYHVNGRPPLEISSQKAKYVRLWNRLTTSA